MGKIFNPPKAPKIQYVRIPEPVTPARPVTNPVANPTAPPSNSTSEVPTEEEEQRISSQLRESSLLRRSRGRFGTISTSFRGFLNDAFDGKGDARKTLLGE